MAAVDFEPFFEMRRKAEGLIQELPEDERAEALAEVNAHLAAGDWGAFYHEQGTEPTTGNRITVVSRFVPTQGLYSFIGSLQERVRLAKAAA